MNTTCKIPGCPLPNIPYVGQAMIRHLKAFHPSIRFVCYKCDRQFTDQNVLIVHLSCHCAIGEGIDKKKIALYDTTGEKRVGYLECPCIVPPKYLDNEESNLNRKPPGPPKRDVITYGYNFCLLFFHSLPLKVDIKPGGKL